MRAKKKPTIAIQLPGALALAAAGASIQAKAATVQITFNGSFFSTSLGNQLDVDYGNDGISDRLVGVNVGAGTNEFIRLRNNSFSLAYARGGKSTYHFAAAGVAGVRNYASFLTSASVSYRAFSSIRFQDTNINSGAITMGYLDITAFARSPGEKRITVNRLVFDDATGGAIGGLNVTDAAFTEYVANAVPEPSSLGLLALGAGGLLARRRRSMAA